MLLDSNIIIYASQPGYSQVRQFIAANAPVVSAVSYVEVLGFHALTDADKQSLRRFFAATRVLPIDQAVVDGAVALRQQRKMSLGDSLIAATALAHGLVLVTRNVSDFRWVVGLDLHDPLAGTPAP